MCVCVCVNEVSRASTTSMSAGKKDCEEMIHAEGPKGHVILYCVGVCARRCVCLMHDPTDGISCRE